MDLITEEGKGSEKQNKQPKSAFTRRKTLPLWNTWKSIAAFTLCLIMTNNADNQTDRRSIP
jgi:hypothetical protein